MPPLAAADSFSFGPPAESSPFGPATIWFSFTRKADMSRSLKRMFRASQRPFVLRLELAMACSGARNRAHVGGRLPPFRCRNHEGDLDAGRLRIHDLPAVSV